MLGEMGFVSIFPQSTPRANCLLIPIQSHYKGSGGKPGQNSLAEIAASQLAGGTMEGVPTRRRENPITLEINTA
ncbi:hypothetical protein J6590_017059, partial [Homalodisca vitripennis]